MSTTSGWGDSPGDRLIGMKDILLKQVGVLKLGGDGEWNDLNDETVL